MWYGLVEGIGRVGSGICDFVGCYRGGIDSRWLILVGLWEMVGNLVGSSRKLVLRIGVR